jgi:hypothetical protein
VLGVEEREQRTPKPPEPRTKPHILPPRTQVFFFFCAFLASAWRLCVKFRFSSLRPDSSPLRAADCLHSETRGQRRSSRRPRVPPCRRPRATLARPALSRGSRAARGPEAHSKRIARCRPGGSRGLRRRCAPLFTSWGCSGPAASWRRFVSGDRLAIMSARVRLKFARARRNYGLAPGQNALFLSIGRASAAFFAVEGAHRHPALSRQTRRSGDRHHLQGQQVARCPRPPSSAPPRRAVERPRAYRRARGGEGLAALNRALGIDPDSASASRCAPGSPARRGA